MLIPDYWVDFSGLTCNKIGVSVPTYYGNHYAFCKGLREDCIHNQIGTFRAEDEALEKEGKETKYRVRLTQSTRL